MEKKRRKLTQCPNCNYTFEDVNNYCPHCGQENHDLNVPVKHLFWEFLEGTIHFDHKVARTIKYLITKPGYLTERFNLGHRMSYVPPFRLYVFVSIVFFFVLGTTSKKTLQVNTSDQQGVAAQANSGGINLMNINAGQPDSAAAIANATADTVNSETNTFIKEKVDKLAGNEEQFRQKIFKNLSFMMFLLMPFFGMILYLFYIKKGRNYVEHLMFSIHLHTFYFILLIVMLLLSKVLPDVSLEGITALLMLVYLFFALRRVYKQTYFHTLLRLIPISMIYMITLIVFVVGVVMISLSLS